MALEPIKPTINGLVSGQFQIYDDDSTGLFWQIKNILFNDQGFCQRNDGDKKLEEIKYFIRDYFEQHPVF